MNKDNTSNIVWSWTFRRGKFIFPHDRFAPSIMLARAIHDLASIIVLDICRFFSNCFPLFYDSKVDNICFGIFRKRKFIYQQIPRHDLFQVLSSHKGIIDIIIFFKKLASTFTPLSAWSTPNLPSLLVGLINPSSTQNVCLIYLANRALLIEIGYDKIGSDSILFD